MRISTVDLTHQKTKIKGIIFYFSEIDINSPRMVGEDLGFIPILHPTSPDSSTESSKNVCNVCGKT